MGVTRQSLISIVMSVWNAMPNVTKNNCLLAPPSKNCTSFSAFEMSPFFVSFPATAALKFK